MMILRLIDMDFTKQTTIALLFLTLYAGVGFAAHLRSGEFGEDAYPFFSWFLFVNVPPRMQNGFVIQITSVKGEDIQPTLLHDFNGYRSQRMRRDVIALEARLGQAVQSGDAARIAAARAELEGGFSDPVQYRVLAILYDPLQYFRNKSIVRENVIAEFQL